ncbi:hypothetical protein L345_04143, partial [Ophiophagus hannah]
MHEEREALHHHNSTKAWYNSCKPTLPLLLPVLTASEPIVDKAIRPELQESKQDQEHLDAVVQEILEAARTFEEFLLAEAFAKKLLQARERMVRMNDIRTDVRSEAVPWITLCLKRNRVIQYFYPHSYASKKKATAMRCCVVLLLFNIHLELTKFSGSVLPLTLQYTWTHGKTPRANFSLGSMGTERGFKKDGKVDSILDYRYASDLNHAVLLESVPIKVTQCPIYEHIQSTNFIKHTNATELKHIRICRIAEFVEMMAQDPKQKRGMAGQGKGICQANFLLTLEAGGGGSLDLQCPSRKTEWLPKQNDNVTELLRALLIRKVFGAERWQIFGYRQAGMETGSPSDIWVPKHFRALKLLDHLTQTVSERSHRLAENLSPGSSQTEEGSRIKSSFVASLVLPLEGTERLLDIGRATATISKTTEEGNSLGNTGLVREGMNGHYWLFSPRHKKSIYSEATFIRTFHSYEVSTLSARLSGSI